jgi:hypothetical protein
MADVDFVSDLNGTGETTFSVNEGSVPDHGSDAVEINNQHPREAQPQPTKVKDDTAEKPLSIRDQISNALKGTSEDTPPAATQDGGRPRNPDGTFAAAAPAPTDTPVDPSATAAPPVAAPPGIDPQVFQSLPAETQGYLARTMEDLNSRHQRVAQLEQVEQLIAPRRQAWAMNGMTEAAALNQLLALSDFAGRDTPGFIKYIAENNGVDLEELVLGQEPVDPQYAALQQQIAQLQAERQQDTQAQMQAAHNQTVQGVVAFAAETGQDGKLLRPYFNELGSEVLPFISAVKAQNPNMTHNQVLQEAYERACWGTPSVRTKMQAAANAAGDAERLRQGADKVDRARSASVSVKSGAPTSTPAAPNDPNRSLRDTIKASIAAAS